jgi:hypothetical protein
MAVFDTEGSLSWPEKMDWSRFEAAETARGAVARPAFPLSLHGGVDATK